MSSWHVRYSFEQEDTATSSEHLMSTKISAREESLLTRAISRLDLVPVGFEFRSTPKEVHVTFLIDADSEWNARRNAADLADAFKSMKKELGQLFLREYHVVISRDEKNA